MEILKNRVITGIFSLMLLFSTSTLLAQDDDDMQNDDEQEVEIDDKQELENDVKKAKAAFLANSPEMKDLFNNTEGYVIFPNVGKGAWILGGAAGNGILYENGKLQGYAEMRQIDIGFQFGGQAYREVIFFRTKEALNKFKQGRFGFEGTASAVIIEEGKAKSVKFEDGVGVAVMPKAGAMIGISVGGQEFDYRDAQ
ncbi:YSC84-related protein [Salinimicrobium soli]|uniref:lipid-binding SYLF domain-containing protein n=1 Tax=Salinimicrobium soli TaxID=1254399 RepID=UPI003AAB764A